MAILTILAGIKFWFGQVATFFQQAEISQSLKFDISGSCTREG
jgi:hypothetical protein